MSAAEVIEQIQKLSPEERDKVTAFVRKLSADTKTERVSDEFKQVADRVFATNAELFRKLAQ